MAVMSLEHQLVQTDVSSVKIKAMWVRLSHLILSETVSAVSNRPNTISIDNMTKIDCCDGTDEYETKIVCNNTCL